MNQSTNGTNLLNVYGYPVFYTELIKVVFVSTISYEQDLHVASVDCLPHHHIFARPYDCSIIAL